MRVEIENLSKRFNREIVFQNLTFSFNSEKKYVITGPNGSGKSTLLQIISGANLPSGGNLTYSLNNRNVEIEEIYQHISYAAPYLDIIEEFTLKEMLQFHFKFKPMKPDESIDSIIEKSLFTNQEEKYIKNFSSGMKQRLKLALAFFSNTQLLLLDEPTSNLDEIGINWYLDNINDQKNRLVILASNVKNEYADFDEELSISDYK